MTSETATLIAAGVAAVAALAAALTSAYTAYFQSTKSAQLRLAEFRRDWIEMLRLRIAEFVGLHFQRDYLFAPLNKNEKKEDADLRIQKYHEITGLIGEKASFVKLCLNMDEKNHRELSELMAFYANNSVNDCIKESNRVGYDLHEKAREILKSEWTRLKTEM